MLGKRRLRSVQEDFRQIDTLLSGLSSQFNSAQASGNYAEVRDTITVVIQNLRKVLDYVAKDIEESTRPSGDSAPIDPHFPFVHPNGRVSGNRKTPSEIAKKFDDKVDGTSGKFMGLRTSKPEIHSLLFGVQGAQWLSDLIGNVNPVKHNDRPQLGKDIIQLSENISQVGGYMQLDAGATFNDEVQTEQIIIDPRGEVSEEFCSRHGITIWEDVSPQTFQTGWFDNLTLWTAETKRLVNAIYKLL